MSNIRALKPRDRILFDAESIASIYRNVGPMVAERMINRAFMTLSDVLMIAKSFSEGGRFTELDAKLAEICILADNLGLTTLSFVAQHARDNLKDGTLLSFDAVWARLLRVADQSMTLQSAHCDQLS